MRLPRVRFTVRRLIAAVAVTAVLMGAFDGYVRLSRKSVGFRARAEEHAGMEQTLRRTIDAGGVAAPVDISLGPGIRSKRFTGWAMAKW